MSIGCVQWYRRQNRADAYMGVYRLVEVYILRVPLPTHTLICFLVTSKVEGKKANQNWLGL